MNTITRDKKFGCGKTLHVHYSNTDYLYVKCGKNGGCENVSWGILNSVHEKYGRKDFIEIVKGFHCEGGCAVAQTCMDWVRRLITGQLEEDKK